MTKFAEIFLNCKILKYFQICQNSGKFLQFDKNCGFHDFFNGSEKSIVLEQDNAVNIKINDLTKGFLISKVQGQKKY